MTLQLTVRSRRLLPGCAFGLSEATALVEVSCSGGEAFDEAAEARIRSRAAAFYPDEDLYLFFGLAERDWPAAFLVDGSADGEVSNQDPAHRLGRWIVALTVVVQRWAHDVAFCGAVLHAAPQRLLLAIPWRTDWMFDGALDFAIRMIRIWVQPEPAADELAEADKYFRDSLVSLHGAGPPLEALRFAQAAAARDIPISTTIGNLRLGWGAGAELLNATFTGHTGLLAHFTAKDKISTSELLTRTGVPVARLCVAGDFEAAEKAAAQLGWPVVVKPPNQDLSVGVVTGIRTAEALRTAFDAAAELSPGRVMVEQHVPGDSYRLLVVHGRLLAAVRRVPAGVTGDGEHSIAELIEAANADHRRKTILKPIKLDDEGLEFLREQGLDEQSVPERGRVVRFAHMTFRRIGGSTEDVAALVHPDNRALAERVARISRLDLAGVDLLITDISRSWREVGGVIGEVNSQPALMPHWLAQPDRDICGEILDLLLENRPTRIPVAAFSGIDGAGVAATLLHTIWQSVGKVTGVCTADGVRIGDDVISTENLAGQPGIHLVFADPAVEAGVFEVPTDTLIEFGHGCDRYDVAAVLNSEPRTAELHAEILLRAHDAVVVNADDPACMAIRSRARAPRHVLVAEDPSSVSLHCSVGGDAAYIESVDGRMWLTLAEGDVTTRVLPMAGGRHQLPALFAAAVAWAQGIAPAAIAAALASTATGHE